MSRGRPRSARLADLIPDAYVLLSWGITRLATLARNVAVSILYGAPLKPMSMPGQVTWLAGPPSLVAVV